MNNLIKNIKIFTSCPAFKSHYCYDLFKMYKSDVYSANCEYNFLYTKMMANIDFYRYTIYRDEYFELLAINWRKGYESGFHTHSKNGCMLKVLHGSLIEQKPCKKYEMIEETELFKDDITYCLGEDEHQIIATSDSISLHLYSPPL